ncbi:MAG: elongation factor Ts [Candidatus Magasanikbacteria bacterium]|nr:elongation factor Ts [Candidatus Magasanikbacteria bacterium]
MALDLKLISEIREITGAGMNDVKIALDEADGDKEKAIDILRKKGVVKAAKKEDRATSQGVVHAYIHAGGRVGTLVKLMCETDFVARTDKFQALAHDLAMHVAAANPLYMAESDVPEAVIEKEKEIYREQLRAEGKSDAVWDKILEGKLQKFFADVCLLQQPYFKEESTTVKQVVQNAIATMGENIQIGGFSRLSL